MRTRPRTLLVLLAGLFLLAIPAFADDAAWHDSTRDVYVDGRLDRSVQILSAEGGKKLAVLLADSKKALRLDRDALTFSVGSKSAFILTPDGAAADLRDGPKFRVEGPLQKVDAANLLLTWKGKTVLVSRHQGLVGDVTEEALFAAVPVWRRLMDSYTPDESAVAALASETRDVTLRVVFGTWCGDSKEFVPRVLKTVRAAANARIRVRLVGLDNDFLRPQDVIAAGRIINVPTVIVESGGREIGRVTETPAGETMETDVAAILGGRAPEHPGRYERGPELARGTYLYRDAGGRRGEERWTIFARKDGGRLVRSRIDTGDLVVEVFQGTDATGKLKFAEITKRQGEAVERARFSVNGDQLSGHLRGREAGILQQNLVLPPSFAFATPAIATSGWMGLAAAAGATSQLVCYVAPSGFESPLGSTCVVTHRVGGAEAVTTPAGEFRATRLARQSGTEASDWWIHPELGIPVRGQVVGGLEYVLTSLELAPRG
ncbi:MAG TPA: thioredoxin family protein [Thermoanaerobaculia bacterium]|nr:thioredoxin family protein [Thermoanaerobaculia bacterium]